MDQQGARGGIKEGHPQQHLRSLVCTNKFGPTQQQETSQQIQFIQLGFSSDLDSDNTVQRTSKAHISFVSEPN